MNTIKKKGGIFIKKKTIFLILALSFLLGIPKVNALDATFYEGEYIDGIYMSKYNPATRTIYYQKARFFRKTGTNEYAYCIEPFQMFEGENTYEETTLPYNLTEEQKTRIAKIAHYGYGFQDHTDVKWYAITQFMIWQVADPSGDYYFTNYANGSRIEPYNEEIAEINSLIAHPTEIPTEFQQAYTIVEDQPLYLEVGNNGLLGFSTTEENVSIGANTIFVEPLKRGEYSFTFTKKDSPLETPLIFYQSSNSQNLLKMGYEEIIECTLSIKVIPTKLEIYKIDEDTNSTIPQGEASLDHAIYELFEENGDLYEEIEINQNTGTVHNLEFGTYTLKEKEAGEGYTTSEEVHTITISKETPIIEYVVKNKVIEKKIIIEKEYGEEPFQKEPDVSFQILNHNEETVQIITTNEEGKAEITLPYGHYTVVQLNTTEGYTKVEPFPITVEDTEEETFSLRDIIIPVPDTHSSLIEYILTILLKVCLRNILV